MVKELHSYGTGVIVMLTTIYMAP